VFGRSTPIRTISDIIGQKFFIWLRHPSLVISKSFNTNMSENIKNTLSQYEEQILNEYYELCSDCNRPNTYFDWCRNCNSKRFRQDFNTWTSGHKLIDNFIQNAQLKARNHEEILEWIPYDHFKNLQFLAKGGFGSVYKAIWLDGYIEKWDIEEQQWKRSFDLLNDEERNVKSPLDKCEKYGQHVVLKSLNNSSNANEDLLNEVK
jgi:hypothetical protein